MTLTKVVLPEYCSPTSVSSISSFQKRERNQSSRREMRASMMAAGSEGGRAGGQAAATAAAAGTTSTRAGLGPDPPTAPRGPGATLGDTGGRRRPKPGSRVGHMTRPPPTLVLALPSAPTARAARPALARRARRLQRHLVGPPRHRVPTVRSWAVYSMPSCAHNKCAG